MQHPRTYWSTSLRTLSESKGFMFAICAIVAVVVLLIVFEAGAVFGYHAALSSYRWGENYTRNFGGPPEGFVGGHGGQALPDGHGAFGQIASLSLPTFVLTDPRHPEERIRIQSDTVIKNLNATVSADTLTDGTYVVVLGDPNTAGEIEAKLIRIMPSPSHAATTTP